MNRIALSFLTTFLAGFSTLFGIIPCFFKKYSQDLIISFSLSFSSGVMLSISLFSLIPEAVGLFHEQYTLFPLVLMTLIFIVIGILFSSVIDQKIERKFSGNALYKLGIISIIVLMLHNIPEGITTFISTSANTQLGISLSLAIALHNIPEGISIAIPIYYATKNIKKAFFYTFIAGFSELFGALLAYFFIAQYVTPFLLAAILGITAGIMIHISIYELLPNSLKYKKNQVSAFGFILGFLVMIICDFIL